MKPEVVVLVCADAEWKALKETVQPTEIETSPFGEWFNRGIIVNEAAVPLAFLQTGCGKIPAAAATQYVLDLWTPKLIINLGTCGGFEGIVKRGDVLLAHRTVVYDICERSGGQDQQITNYSTCVDLSWLGEQPYPMGARPVTIASADQDLDPENIVFLNKEHGAVAADWESGAIAYVAWKKNKTKCLIVRGVSDIVGPGGNEIYEKPNAFVSIGDVHNIISSRHRSAFATPTSSGLPPSSANSGATGPPSLLNYGVTRRRDKPVFALPAFREMPSITAPLTPPLLRHSLFLLFDR